MANPNVGEMISSTIQARNREYADNMEDNNAILFWLKKKGNIRPCDGGEKIYEEVNYTDNTNVNSYDGYDTLATGAQQTFDTAEFAWKQYSGAIVVSGREKRQNSGRAKMIDLVSARIDNLRKSLRNRWALDAYGDGTGNGGKNLTGLASLVPTDPTTGTAGGISRVNFVFWRSQLKDPAVTPTATTLIPSMNDLWVSAAAGRTSRSSSSPTTSCTRCTSRPAAEPALHRLGDGGGRVRERQVQHGPGHPRRRNRRQLHRVDDVLHQPGLPLLAAAPELNFSEMGEAERDPVNQDATVRHMGIMGNITSSGPQFSGRLIGT
jgi:hypothetical protein